jgi:hypothetical protein
VLLIAASGAACSASDDTATPVPSTLSGDSTSTVPGDDGATTTTPPAPPTTVGGTTAPPGPPPADGSPPAAHIELVREAVDALNAAFARSVAQGIAASVAANYWVAAGTYTIDECRHFQSANGGDQIAVALGLRTLQADPGWVDPVTGRQPQGTIYELGVDDTRTVVGTGARSQVARQIHVSLPGDGTVRFMLRCR